MKVNVDLKPVDHLDNIKRYSQWSTGETETIHTICQFNEELLRAHKEWFMSVLGYFPKPELTWINDQYICMTLSKVQYDLPEAEALLFQLRWL